VPKREEKKERPVPPPVLCFGGGRWILNAKRRMRKTEKIEASESFCSSSSTN
jgi:hypothetical protein